MAAYSIKPSVREIQLEKELNAARERIGQMERRVNLLETELLRKRKVEAAEATLAFDSTKKVKLTPVTPAAFPKLVTTRWQQTIKNSLKGIKFSHGWDAANHTVNMNDVISMKEFQPSFETVECWFSRLVPTKSRNSVRETCEPF